MNFLANSIITIMIIIIIIYILPIHPRSRPEIKGEMGRREKEEDSNAVREVPFSMLIIADIFEYLICSV